MARVLVVGKGTPEHGGIPSYIDLIMNGRQLVAHQLRFVNLTRASPPQGGKATVANLRRTVKDAAEVWGAARGADVVHIHTALAPGVTAARAGLLSIVGRARGARVLLHVHGGLVPLWATGVPRRAVLALATRAADLVVPVSESVAVTLRGLPGRHQVEVLDNGVDADRFAPSDPADSPVAGRVLYVGLLTPRKGLVDLLDARAQLHDEGLAHELCLVGGTPDEGAAAEELVRARLTEDVTVLGTVEHAEMPAVYRTAAVFCLPSWYEAMPLSVLEAMACGVPVVATDVGDVARLVLDGETGLLVPPRDPPALAAALSRLLRDPELRTRMGAAGRRRVLEQFSGAAVLARLDVMYDDLGGRTR